MVVKSNIDKEITIGVLRINSESGSIDYKGENYDKLKLTLTPRNWSGQGYLGCGFKKL